MNSLRLGTGGSSPHTRGAQHSDRVDCQLDGIIPAYAGSTSSRSSSDGSRRDHPRIRGEHDVAIKYRISISGSSPHTRGAQIWRSADVSCSGIIPAYAGSTQEASARKVASRDHPRIRGEHNTRDGDLIPSRGSSPHTRGAQAVVKNGGLGAGIIPAYAGSTSEQQDLVFFLRDHPRIRGEHG